jgi:hypothetical protein
LKRLLAYPSLYQYHVAWFLSTLREPTVWGRFYRYILRKSPNSSLSHCGWQAATSCLTTTTTTSCKHQPGSNAAVSLALLTGNILTIAKNASENCKE